MRTAYFCVRCAPQLFDGGDRPEAPIAELVLNAFLLDWANGFVAVSGFAHSVREFIRKLRNQDVRRNLLASFMRLASAAIHDSALAASS